MKKILEEVADILMYYGPSKEEIIQTAISKGLYWSKKEYQGQLQCIKVIEHLPFSTVAIDSYTFNSENQLIKHVFKINEKETVIFDKFAEARDLLDSIKANQYLVS